MNEVEIKVCFRCKGELPATTEYFSPRANAKDGFSTYCRACKASYMREYQKSYKPKPQPVVTDGIKRCSSCERDLPATTEHFYRAKVGKYGIMAICKRCHLERHRQYHQENREHLINVASLYQRENREYVRTRKRLYYRANPEKARELDHRRRARKRNAEGSFTKEDVQLMLRQQKNKCWYCQKKLNGKYHIDHRIPLSRGGSNNPSNLVLTCPKCNLSKNDRLPHEWGDRLL